jgi:transposase
LEGDHSDRWPALHRHHRALPFRRRHQWRALPYIEQMLAPTLRPEDIVLLDNLSSHKIAGIAEAITAQGAQLVYLSPYSPDLNPIEQAFAKFKAALRQAAERTREALWRLIGQTLDRSTRRRNAATSLTVPAMQPDRKPLYPRQKRADNPPQIYQIGNRARHDAQHQQEVGLLVAPHLAQSVCAGPAEPEQYAGDEDDDFCDPN